MDVEEDSCCWTSSVDVVNDVIDNTTKLLAAATIPPVAELAKNRSANYYFLAIPSVS